MREGYLRQMIPYPLPLTLGWDVSDIVESAGAKVTRFKVCEFSKNSLGWLIRAKVCPVIGAEFSLRDAAKAHALSETGRSVGKIVLYVGQP